MFTLLTISAIQVPCSFAVPEPDLSRTWRDIYGDWQKTNCVWLRYESSSGKKTGFARCGVGNKPVVILPGYSEPALKYMETVYDLIKADTGLGPFYVWELPGQGTSDRLGPTAYLVHVDTPDRYIDDFLRFMEQEVRSRYSSKPILVAHSTGALIAFNAAARRSGDISTIVALSPLVRPALPLPSSIVGLIAQFYRWFGFGSSSVWGQSSKPVEDQTYATNKSTDSSVRWNISHSVLVENPNLFSHGVSWDWLSSVLDRGDDILANYKNINLPVAIIKPESDFYVNGVASDAFCKNLVDCTSTTISGDMHELLQLSDGKRNVVMSAILNKLSSIPDSN